LYSYIKKNLSRLSFLSIVAHLLLSGLAHLWNPIGFPHGPVNDEGIYLRRAMNVVEGHGPQELSPLYYDPRIFCSFFWLACSGWLVILIHSLLLAETYIILKLFILFQEC
jgi:hypothetical protein